jgi:nucleoside-diphosphate-sugar epimerase
MRAFVTGHRGYIGSHVVDLLKQAGHTAVGCDLGLFDRCSWEQAAKPDVELVKDIRRIGPTDLEGCECVIHLAALSNDTMGALNAELTMDVNCSASIRLARLAKEAGVPRFLFSGSCSVYGRGEKLDLGEGDQLDPLTTYAQSKVKVEMGVSELADQAFSPTYLRSATAYGHSPTLRVDLVANNLLASARVYNEIRIQSDGTPWRPLIHCRDIARAFVALASAPRSTIHNRAINVGANTENYQVRDVAEAVHCLIPSARIVYTGEVGADPRNYRVRFDLLNQLLPDYRLEYNLFSGLEELFRKMVEHRFSREDFEGDRFVRLRALKSRLHLLSGLEER